MDGDTGELYDQLRGRGDPKRAARIPVNNSRESSGQLSFCEVCRKENVGECSRHVH